MGGGRGCCAASLPASLGARAIHIGGARGKRGPVGDGTLSQHAARASSGLVFRPGVWKKLPGSASEG